MKPPAPRNRECDAIRSRCGQLQIAQVLLRVVSDLLDLALGQKRAWSAILAPRNS